MSKTEKAFVAPLLIFLSFLALVQLIQEACEGSDSLWLESPQYWIFPIQTIVCAILVWRFRHAYPLAVRQWGVALGIGLIVFLVWISPQEIFGATRRFDGFNPFIMGPNGILVGGTLFFRLIRLIIVVPLVEEIFWRGYLLRYLINHNFTRVPIGTYSRESFVIVTLAFTLIHNPVDYPAAFITGALFNVVAYRTKSIGSCVIAHATANALLGGYILASRQWGFW